MRANFQSMDAQQMLEDVTGRVREALAHAESRAKEIVSEAEKRARGLVAEAEAEAKRIRERAEAEADERMGKVREALATLEGAFGGRAEVEPPPAPAPEPSPPVIPEPTPPSIPEPTPPVEPEPLPPEPEIEPPAPPQPDREPPRLSTEANGGAATRSSDDTAARIVATKMALDGESRQAIAARLAEDYDLEHADSLLDDVLARAKR